MRRIGILLAILLLCLPGFAAAESGEMLDIAAALNPYEMVAPGDAVITITITNRGPDTARGVSLSSYDGLTTETVGDIAAGETKVVTRVHAVSEEELQAGRVIFTVSHASPEHSDVAVNYTVSVPVRRAEPAPDAAFTRAISSLRASGGSATIVYTVENTGNEPLLNIRVQDPAGDYSGRAEELSVGGKLVFVNRVAIEESIISRPTLSFGAPSLAEARSVALDEAEILPADAELSMNMAVRTLPGGQVVVKLSLANTGNTDLSSVAVYEAGGGLLFDGIGLSAGEQTELDRVVPLRGAFGIRWRATGFDEAGLPVQAEAGAAAGLGFPMQATSLTLTASPSAEKISRPGYVSFRLTLSNSGDAVYGVVIGEMARGEIRRFAVTPSLTDTVRQVEYRVEDDAVFTFFASYTDVNGETVTVMSEPVRIGIAPDGADPIPAPEEDGWIRGVSQKLGNGSVYVIMLAAVLAVLTVLLLVLRIRSRRDARQRVLRRRRRRRGEKKRGIRNV